MQKPEYLERIAYELAQDNQAEGVRYIEVRFAPQLHINKTMDMNEVLQHVNNGLFRAQQDFNRRPEIKSGEEPPFFYGHCAPCVPLTSICRILRTIYQYPSIPI